MLTEEEAARRARRLANSRAKQGTLQHREELRHAAIYYEQVRMLERRLAALGVGGRRPRPEDFKTEAEQRQLRIPQRFPHE